MPGPEIERAGGAQNIQYRTGPVAAPEPVLQAGGINRHLVELRYQRKAMQSAINQHPCQPIQLCWAGE